MCETCGCSGEEGGFKIYKPGEKSNLTHVHDHEHSHSHGEFTHTHDGHTHTHSHEHVKHTINLEHNILEANDKLAERNRGYFDAKEIKTLNLVSSPGSGKTSILEKTITALDNTKCYVIEGDQQTDNDAKRIAVTGAEVVQVNTGNACHLDSNMVHEALHQLKPKEKSLIFIENVGNLVCPALFDLGESSRVVIFSTTEGEDKPLKYPNMFHSSHVCLINKIDLLPYLDFNIELAKQNVLKVNPNIQIIEISAKTGQGINGWLEWLRK